MREARGGGGQPDVGGGGERGEEHLFGRTGHAAGRRAAQLQAPGGGPDEMARGIVPAVIPVQRGMRDRERGVPLRGEGGVRGTSFRQRRPVKAGDARRLADVAGATKRLQEGTVLQQLRSGEGPGHGDGVGQVFQLCKQAAQGTTIGAGKTLVALIA